MHNLRYDLRVVSACARNDIRLALAERLFTVGAMLIPVNVLLMLSLFVLSGSNAPTAVVMLDTGPYAQSFYDTMAHAHSFRLFRASASQAHAWLVGGHVVAVVTIPADFDARVAKNQPVQVGVAINNLNTDFTNDIRRAVPMAITSLYAKVYPNLVTMTSTEHDVQPTDTPFVPFLAVSIAVVALMMGGMLQAGVGTSREWELGTMKELLLSPASRWAVLTGKMLGAFALGFMSVALVLVTLLLLGVHPVHWGETVVFTLLVLLIFVALGSLLGTAIRRRMAVVVPAAGSALGLFFMSDPFDPISFSGTTVERIAEAFPVCYAMSLLQHAYHGFDLNTLGVVGAWLLLGYLAAAMVVSIAMLQRSTVAR